MDDVTMRDPDSWEDTALTLYMILFEYLRNQETITIVVVVISRGGEIAGVCDGVEFMEERIVHADKRISEGIYMKI